jgi:hypothetical protein
MQHLRKLKQVVDIVITSLEAFVIHTNQTRSTSRKCKQKQVVSVAPLAWRATPGEDQRLRVFDKVQRGITAFGPKIDEVTEGWKKLRNEEVHNV